MSDTYDGDNEGEGSDERGCGRRVAGGIYLETKLAPAGAPGAGGTVPSYLQCPPIVIDSLAMGISPVGVTLFERDGVTHVIDWIGSKHYPNVADFVEEAKRMGVSRRISKATDFSKLTRESRLLLVHARAHIDNADEYPGVNCPVSETDHDWNMCVGLYWRDLDPSTVQKDEFAEAIVRPMPGFRYIGLARAAHVTPSYSLAIFMSLPIGQITVIADDMDGTDVDAFDRASASSLPVVIEES